MWCHTTQNRSNIWRYETNILRHIASVQICESFLFYTEAKWRHSLLQKADYHNNITPRRLSKKLIEKKNFPESERIMGKKVAQTIIVSGVQYMNIFFTSIIQYKFQTCYMYIDIVIHPSFNWRSTVRLHFLINWKTHQQKSRIN